VTHDAGWQALYKQTAAAVRRPKTAVTVIAALPRCGRTTFLHALAERIKTRRRKVVVVRAGENGRSPITTGYEKLFFDALGRRTSAPDEQATKERMPVFPNDLRDMRELLSPLVGDAHAAMLIDNADVSVFDDPFVNAILNGKSDLPLPTSLVIAATATAELFARLATISAPYRFAILPPPRVPGPSARLTIPGVVPTERATELDSARLVEAVSQDSYYANITVSNTLLDRPAPRTLTALLYALGEIPDKAVYDLAYMLGGTEDVLANWLETLHHVAKIIGRWMFLDGWRPYVLSQLFPRELAEGLSTLALFTMRTSLARKGALPDLWMRRIAPVVDEELERAVRDTWQCARKLRYGFKHPVARKQRIEALVNTVARIPLRHTVSQKRLLIQAQEVADRVLSAGPGQTIDPPLLALFDKEQGITVYRDSIVYNHSVVVGQTATINSYRFIPPLAREEPRLYSVATATAALVSRRRNPAAFQRAIVEIAMLLINRGEHVDRHTIQTKLNRVRQDAARLFHPASAAHADVMHFTKAVHRYLRLAPPRQTRSPRPLKPERGGRIVAGPARQAPRTR